MERLFSHPDGRFQVRLTEPALDQLATHCHRGWPRETGGILIGYYTPRRECAVVTRAEAPPEDSSQTPFSFSRGIRGLRSLLHHLWHRPAADRLYYLGEWHLHPSSQPLPSRRDRTQMQAIADGPYHCPEPVLLLVGGREAVGWTFGVQVFRRRQKALHLQAITSNSSARQP